MLDKKNINIIVAGKGHEYCSRTARCLISITCWQEVQISDVDQSWSNLQTARCIIVGKKKKLPMLIDRGPIIIGDLRYSKLETQLKRIILHIDSKRGAR